MTDTKTEGNIGKYLYTSMKYKFLAKSASMKYSSDIGVTLVEFEDFTRFVDKNLRSDEYEDLISYLAGNPEVGDIISGTGGIRKLCWAAKGKGKSGGVRVIYYYHDIDMPLLLLTGFAKNEMGNIGQGARNAYKKLIPVLVQQYKLRDKK